MLLSPWWILKSGEGVLSVNPGISLSIYPRDVLPATVSILVSHRSDFPGISFGIRAPDDWASWCRRGRGGRRAQDDDLDCDFEIKNSSVKCRNCRRNWINVIFVVLKMKGLVGVQKMKILSMKIQVRVPTVKILRMFALKKSKLPTKF